MRVFRMGLLACELVGWQVESLKRCPLASGLRPPGAGYP